MSAQWFSAQALAKPLMMSREHARLQLARAEVIEEEERLGAQHGDVVDAMVDQVLADGVVAVHREGELELGADAIHAGDQHRLAVFAHVQREEAAEAADLAEHLGPMRGPRASRQGGLDPVAQVNIDARAGVCLLFHGRESSGQRGRSPSLSLLEACPEEASNRDLRPQLSPGCVFQFAVAAVCG